MVRQDDKIGTDAEWLKSGISPFRSANSTIEYCEESCLENQRCYLEGKQRYGLAGKNMDPIFGNIQQD
jgi:hypothetical protein